MKYKCGVRSTETMLTMHTWWTCSHKLGSSNVHVESTSIPCLSSRISGKVLSESVQGQKVPNSCCSWRSSRKLPQGPATMAFQSSSSAQSGHSTTAQDAAPVNNKTDFASHSAWTIRSCRGADHCTKRLQKWNAPPRWLLWISIYLDRSGPVNPRAESREHLVRA